MGSIVVINASSEPCHVFVSKWTCSSGEDGWHIIKPGERASWWREGWECVGFKNASDTERAGVYVRVNTIVTYQGLAPAHKFTTS